jgi:transposase-like protein
MGAADSVTRIKCARCGRDWTDELATRVTGIAGTLWQVMCSCGAELYAEGTESGVRLVAGLEQRPA